MRTDYVERMDERLERVFAGELRDGAFHFLEVQAAVPGTVQRFDRSRDAHMQLARPPLRTGEFELSLREEVGLGNGCPGSGFSHCRPPA